MILGIGHDLTELKRVEQIISTSKRNSFINRILTPHELTIFESLKEHRQVEFAAGRFAGKEAVSKAFGCGIGEKLTFQDISIVKDQLGKPVVHISEKSLMYLGYVQDQIIVHISITHTQSLASAFVTVERL